MSTDQNALQSVPHIVLVHRAWADGSSWSAVIERVQADGYHVTAPIESAAAAVAEFIAVG